MSYADAGSSSTPAPIKLKFKLGGPTPTGSPTLPSSPAPSEPDYAYAGSTKSEADYPASAGDGSEGGSVPPVGLAFPPAVGSGSARGASLSAGPAGGDKPKRKRAPKKGPNEPVQPGGKGWRKGVKGIIVAGQPIPARDPSVPIPIAPPSVAAQRAELRAATQVGAAANVVKGNLGYLTPQELERSTPKPRQWARSLRGFTSITGVQIQLKCWHGDSHSPYRAAMHPTPPPSLAHAPLPPLPMTATPHPHPHPHPHPLSNPSYLPQLTSSSSSSTSPSQSVFTPA